MFRKSYSPFNVTRSISITREDFDYFITVSGRYTPGRDAPHCDDHDSPLFSDCGEPCEFDVSKIVIEQVVDIDGSIIDSKHEEFPNILKAEQIELTDNEVDDIIVEICEDDYADPDPDIDYEHERELRIEDEIYYRSLADEND